MLFLSALTPFRLRLILGAVGVVAVLGAGAYLRHRGYSACERDHQADLAAHLQRGIEQAREIARQDAEVSEYYERIRTRIETKIITISDEVAHEVPADCRKCSLSPIGLQRLNDALRGVRPAPADPEQPDGGMPGTAAPPRWQLPGGQRPSGDGGPALLKLRSATQLADPRIGQP